MCWGNFLGKYLNWASNEKEAQILYKFRVGPLTMSKQFCPLATTPKILYQEVTDAFVQS